MTALIKDLRRGVSPVLKRRIRRHRRAFHRYGQLIPLGDPVDGAFLRQTS